MHLLRNTSLAEDPDAQEGRFHEERHQRLDRERRAEDIAHITGIFRPVHAELEFLHNSGHNANGKVDQEQLPPEFRHFAPGLVPGLIIAGLHICNKPPQSQREWDEEKVIDSRETKLPS